ncbi:MAG: hypothetical protein ACREOD_10500, partial [Candidatus Dormibacteria bacterium]
QRGEDSVHAELRGERASTIEVQVINARNLKPCLPVGWQVGVMNNSPRPKNNERPRRFGQHRLLVEMNLRHRASLIAAAPGLPNFQENCRRSSILPLYKTSFYQ